MEKEFGIEGIDYQVITDVEGKMMIINLLGMPGTEKKIKLSGNYSTFKTAAIDGGKSQTWLFVRYPMMPKPFTNRPVLLQITMH